MSLNRIQLSEISAYVQLFGAPTISMDLFVALLGKLDTRYLELKKDRSGNNKPSGKR